jgi:hypothetical protein
MRRRRWLLLSGILVVAATITTACATEPEGPTAIQPVSGTEALLDVVSGEIVMPLDPYRFAASSQNMQAFRRAESIAVGRCMNAAGLPYSAAAAIDSPDSFPEDRPFGLWNRERALLYGSGVGESAVQAAFEQDLAIGGPNWEQAVSECYNYIAAPVNAGEVDEDVVYIEELAFMPTNADYSRGLGERLAGEAYAAAIRDPRFATARSAWERCLTENGLTPVPDSWAPSEQAAPGSEQDIEHALIDVDCDDRTGKTQALANVLAEYEQAMLESNEAALVALKQDMDGRVSAARAYISENG